jgi:hypothetical protein
MERTPYFLKKFGNREAIFCRKNMEAIFCRRNREAINNI